MPWLKWLPWRFLLRRAARAHGFLDPLALLARLHRFAQPSEVGEPIELLRAGALFHARGLINARVIQHNLDWVWPYWIERQFDPRNESFIPRAFSITHVNLTHRNWTAIGWPDCPELPIVDPRGLLTPCLDGWSLDAWIVTQDGHCLLPSRAPSCSQRLELAPAPVVVTETAQDGLALSCHAGVEQRDGVVICSLEVTARAVTPAWTVLALRPYNPEGVSFIHELRLTPERRSWTIDGRPLVRFSAPAERHHVSDYRRGDVHIHLQDQEDREQVTCEVGMATAAAMFRLEPARAREIGARIGLTAPRTRQTGPTWAQALAGHCALRVPEARIQGLYDAALRTLVLHSPGDVYAGPYTYKRFWFRDAAFIIQGLLCAGFSERAEQALDRFPTRQNTRGYFLSQEGEWDSNGEALWIMHRFCELTGRPPKQAWRQTILRGARWIARKRLASAPTSPHAGLLPAGFSAEHLGPNDYYYWDDFWGIAGLRAAAALADAFDAQAAAEFAREAQALEVAVGRSLARAAERLGRPAMPASPHRRLDAGAIGSLVTAYPLALCPPRDPRVLDTVEYLLQNCFVDGGFFQDMIHSGINPYLTLHVAQVLLRAGDARSLELMETVAALASPTAQWPEAIHPRTGGGCMGDGQHVWAAAEWVLMVRNALVREEGNRLILAGGMPRRWLQGEGRVSFGPAPTRFGTISLALTPLGADRVRIAWRGAWHKAPPVIQVQLPGSRAITAQAGQDAVEMPIKGSA
jgi:hypothetical protein